MEFQINCTQDGVKSYPMHKHNSFEIMLYLCGEGRMRTPDRDYPFSAGSIIIMPPGTEHGSDSENGFKNISFASDELLRILNLDKPVVLCDNELCEGRQLAEMIYRNRYGGRDYLSALCSAYTHFILSSLKIEDKVSAAVNKIVAEITDNFHDSNISLSGLLRESGYAEDYIRARFKKITGKTPNEFLTNVRIKHACYLMEIYNSMPFSQIAERCGYTDYIYFSKKFRSVTAMSPREYLRGILSPKPTA